MGNACALSHYADPDFEETGLKQPRQHAESLTLQGILRGLEPTLQPLRQCLGVATFYQSLHVRLGQLLVDQQPNRRSRCILIELK